MCVCVCVLGEDIRSVLRGLEWRQTETVGVAWLLTNTSAREEEE